MRRFLLVAMLTCAAVCAACAQTLTLPLPVVMRAGPGLHFREVGAMPPGAPLTVLREGRVWSRVESGGRRGYAVTADLFGPRPTRTKLPPPLDPNCDYGYPYSGSGQYFATPLNDLRHSAPLGALLGYHLRYPC